MKRSNPRRFELGFVTLAVTMLSLMALSGVAPAVAQEAGTHVSNPTIPNFYVNGFYPYTGTFNYTRAPASSTSVNITATYPWSTYPSVANSIPLNYSIKPFPLSSSMPKWLAVSFSPSSEAMARGKSASTTMEITLSSEAQSGQSGWFALDAFSTEPVSGTSGVFVIDFQILVNNSATGALKSMSVSNPSSGPLTPSPPALASSWALGAGLCDSAKTTPCGGTSITWSSEDGTRDHFTIPSFVTNGDGAVALMVNLASVASNGSLYVMQYLLWAPGSGTNWLLNMQIQYPHTNGTFCSHNTGTVSSSTYSTDTLEIYYSTGWLAQDSDTGQNYLFSSNCSPGAPGSTASGAQEPFAIESTDGTSGDFSNLVLNVSPVFQYTSNGGSSWTNPAGAWVVDGCSTCISSWSNYVVGDGTATPSYIIEAGSSQSCSGATTYQVFVWDTTQSTCGTNTILTKLN
jgi:hypothetical protein